MSDEPARRQYGATISLNRVPEDPYLIEGLRAIAANVGRSPHTVKVWIYRHGFPCCHLPNGHWCTTPGLIDQWVLARCELEKGERAKLQPMKRRAAAQATIARRSSGRQNQHSKPQQGGNSHDG